MIIKSNKSIEQSSYIKNAKLIERDEEIEDEVLLYADFKNGIVLTNCGDFYYDYSISFDDFIKFAEYIKKERKKWQIPTH